MCIQSDSPPVGQNLFRVFLVVEASENWKVESTDIKSAFLHRVPLEREIFINPSKDVMTEGGIWQLKKCIYGLNDTPRKWFLNVERTLKDLGCTQTKMDPAVFHTSLVALCGVLLVHVDDFLASMRKEILPQGY